MQKGIQKISKKVPKLHLYYSILPKKAIPKGLDFQSKEQSKPKAKRNELHQNVAYLEHQHLRE
jgi:hypothetical protein